MHFTADPTDPTVWVFIAVVLFFVLLAYFGVHKKIAEALDKRSAAIKAELEEARRLREEAQALLASFQRQQKEAEAQAEEIVRQARADAESMATQARADLAERIERRAAQAEAKIANAETQAMNDVKAKAADLALDTAEEIIRTKLTAKDKGALIQDGIKQMGAVMR